MNYINEYRFWNKDSGILDKISKKVNNIDPEDIIFEDISAGYSHTYRYSFTLEGFEIKCSRTFDEHDWYFQGYKIEVDNVKLSISSPMAMKLFKKIKSIKDSVKKEEENHIKKDLNITLREGKYWNKDSQLGEKIFNKLDTLDSSDIKMSESRNKQWKIFIFNLLGFEISCMWDIYRYGSLNPAKGYYTIEVDNIKLDLGYFQAMKIYQKVKKISQIDKKENDRFSKKDLNITLSEGKYWNKDSDIGDSILKKLDTLTINDISVIDNGSGMIENKTFYFNLKEFEIQCNHYCGSRDIIGHYKIKADNTTLDIGIIQARKIYNKIKSIINEDKKKKEDDIKRRKKEEENFFKKDLRITLRENIKKFENFTMGDDICDICGGSMFNGICENCENVDIDVEIPKDEKDESHYNNSVPQTTRSQNVYYENRNSNQGYTEMEETKFNSEVYGDIDTGWINGYEDEDDYATIDYIKNKWDSFTESEIKELKKYFEDVQDMLSYGEGWENKDLAIGIPKMSKIYVSDVNHWSPESKHILITKFKDEWYYLKDESPLFYNPAFRAVNGEYYKCDQFEGLISLIKKIIKI